MTVKCCRCRAARLWPATQNQMHVVTVGHNDCTRHLATLYSQLVLLLLSHQHLQLTGTWLQGVKGSCRHHLGEFAPAFKERPQIWWFQV